MEALVACSTSERYIHVSSLAVPYNNADVATLGLKHRVKMTQNHSSCTNSVQNTPASFNGNLMQAYFMIFLISLLRIAKYCTLEISISFSYLLFILTLSTHESLCSTMNGFLTLAMSCICIDFFSVR